MANIVDRDRLFLFPSVVFKGKVDDDALIERLKSVVTDLKQKETGEFSYSKQQFETEDNLHERPEFKELCDLILETSSGIMDEQRLIRESHYITNMWATSTNKHFYHPLHTHPNCYMSGIIYLNAPEHCGKLVFRDPRPGHAILQYDYEEYNSHNSSRQYVKPGKGVILFWPHWLEHMVERHDERYTGEEDRMMIAFNIMIKTDIKIRTAKLRI